MSLPRLVILMLLAFLPAVARAQQATLVEPELFHSAPEAEVHGAGRAIDLSFTENQVCVGDLPANYTPAWTWQVVPAGLIYRSYLAGPRESRLSSIYNWNTKNGNKVWDFTLGGHVGLLRYGTTEGPRPGGFQLDVEGAAFPRLDGENDMDLIATDFRGGFPLTFGYGPLEMKGGYYHTSSHLGDEFMIKNPTYPRINYVRDEIIFGLAWRIRPSFRVYGDAGYAFHRDGGVEPWAFNVGAECSELGPTDLRGAPFFAVNGHIREDYGWCGSVNAQAGWQWRGYGPGHLLRLGVNYFNGITEEYALGNVFEELVGIAAWYDY